MDRMTSQNDNCSVEHNDCLGLRISAVTCPASVTFLQLWSGTNCHLRRCRHDHSSTTHGINYCSLAHNPPSSSAASSNQWLVVLVGSKEGILTKLFLLLYPSIVQLFICVLDGLQVQQIGFLSQWNPYAVISLEAVAFVHVVTRWNGSGGIEAYLSDQLASFSAMTPLVVSSGL